MKNNTYLVKCSRTGIYKIGHSLNPRKRLSGLKVGNPFVELIGTSKIAEKILHEKYVDYRIAGEWFDFPDDVETTVINEFHPWVSEPKLAKGHKKGLKQTADVLDFEYAKGIAEELLNSDKIPKKRLGLFIIIGIFTGIKTKHLMNLKYEDIRGVEQLTQSRNNKNENQGEIPIPSIIQYYLETKFKGNTGSIFVTQKAKGGNIISIQSLNKSLKDAFNNVVDKKISTHTFRKIYGRKIYEINDNSISALLKLQILFGQSSIKTTREYLHINNDTIDDVQLIIEE